MTDFQISYPFSRSQAEDIHEPLLAVVTDMIKKVQETEEGFLLSFGRVAPAIQPLTQLMEVERVLNPFMRMALVVESSEGPVKLELSGPTGTKDFLMTEFGLRRWLT